MPGLQAIIFDMDGTLADTEEIHRLAFNAAFTEFGCGWQWSPAEYHELLAVSGGRERIEGFLARRGNGADADERRRLAAAIHARKSQIYVELLSSAGMRLRPGVQRLLDAAAKADLPLGIATSSSRRNLDTLLATTLGRAGSARFRAIVTCDIVEEKKPSPAVYRRALAELGADGSHCVAIEDTRNGNLAALAAGLSTVITTHAFTVDNDFSGAALVVDQLGEPDQPMRVLAGDAGGAHCVDLALLEHIVGRATAANAAQPARAAGRAAP